MSLSEKKADWKCLGPFNTVDQLNDQHAGVITCISVNPSDSADIYIGTGNAGLFHTSNRGKTWHCLTDDYEYPVIGINNLYVDYSKQPCEIIMATGKENEWYNAFNAGILHSRDGGRHWQRTYPNPLGSIHAPSLKNILIDTVNHYWFTIEKNKIYRSNDEGKNWKEIFSKQQFYEQIPTENFSITSLLQDAGTSSLWITLQMALSSLPAGNEFQAEPMFLELKNSLGSIGQMQLINHTPALKSLYDPEGDATTAIMKLVPAAKNTLCISRQIEESKEIILYNFQTIERKFINYRITNEGKLKEDLHWFHGLYINQRNPAIMYTAGTILYASNDSGSNFRRRYAYGFGDNNEPHADIRSMLITRYSEDGLHDEIYLGTDGGLSYSSDGGRTFENLNGSFLPITEFYGMGVSPFSGIISAGSQDNSIFSFDPTTNQWHFEVRGDGYDVTYDLRKKGVAYGQYNSQAIYSTQNDIAPFEYFLRGGSRLASNRKTLQTHPNGNLYFADQSFHILRKGSDRWESYETHTPHQALAFEVSQSNSNTIYLSSFWEGLYKSTDGGRTFQDITAKVNVNGMALGKTRITAICIDPGNEDRLWIGLGYLGNYYDACNPGVRVLRSDDGGETWMDYSDGLPTYNVTDLVLVEGSSGTLFAATVEGVYLRVRGSNRWGLFSTNLPKCLITELDISYCRGKLIASTYGRGLWETSLPEFKFDDPILIKKPTVWTADSNEVRSLERDVRVLRKGSLIIECPVHVAKGKSIFMRKKNQLVIRGRGKLLNECGEDWGGIQIKK